MDTSLLTNLKQALEYCENVQAEARGQQKPHKDAPKELNFFQMSAIKVSLRHAIKTLEGEADGEV